MSKITVSDEVKEKISVALKGRSRNLSKETLKLLSETAKGYS